MADTPQQLPDEADLQNDPAKYLLYICCTFCCCAILFVLLPFVLAMLGMTSIKPDNLLTPKQYSNVEDCLSQRFGSGQSGICNYNGPNISGASRTNIDTAVKYLSGKGFNKTAIAGIIGNWVQESSVDPTNCQDSCESYSGGNTAECAKDIYNCGYGLAQWTSKNRKTNLVDFASKQNKSADSMQLQLDFFMWEVNNDYPTLIQEMNADSSVQDAVYTFEEIFERAGEPAYSNRVDFANDAFEGISCNSSSSTNDASKTNNNEVKINGVPYFNQQDYNTLITEWNAPISELGCGITCAAMISSFVNEKETKPDEYYQKYGASHLNSMQKATGKKALTQDIAWDFENNKDENWEKIKNQVSKGNPVMIFTGYSGTHIILIVGYSLNNDNTIKEVIVHDPYNNFYKQTERKADYKYYPFDDFNKYLTTQKHVEGSKVYFLDFSRPSAVNSNPQYEQWMIDECEEILKNQTGSSTGSLLSSCDIPGITFDNGTYDHIYLHWSGGSSYENAPEEPYHIAIDDKGNVYQNHPFSYTGSGGKVHTEKRSDKSIGIVVLGMGDYKPGMENDPENNYGAIKYPITDAQITTMAKVTAKIASHYNIPIDIKHVMTHAEAGALKDFDIELVKKVSANNINCTGCQAGCDSQAEALGMPHTNYGPNNWGDGWPAGTSCRWDLMHHGDIIRNQAKECISTSNNTSTGNMPHYCQAQSDGCGPTALLMLLQSYGLASDQTQAGFYNDFESGYGSGKSTWVDQLQKQAEKFTPASAKLCWHTGLSAQKIIDRAKKGEPTEVGTLYFVDLYNSSSSGHYITIKGYTKKDNKEYLIASDSACWSSVPDNANELIPLPDFFNSQYWPDDQAALYATPCN